MSPEQVQEVALWMDDQFSSGNLEGVWAKRLALGYGVPQEGVSDNVWFWLNAYPAVAGLRLGYRDHPFLATCAGSADQVRDWQNAQHEAAMNEINTRFFA